MEIVLVVLLGLNLAALAWVAMMLRAQGRRTRLAEQAIGQMEPHRPLPAEVEESLTAGTRRVITIEILNPLELAATKSRFGGVAGALAPATIRRLVYEQTVKEMRAQMADQGVVAEVGLHVSR